MSPLIDHANNCTKRQMLVRKSAKPVKISVWCNLKYIFFLPGPQKSLKNRFQLSVSSDFNVIAMKKTG